MSAAQVRRLTNPCRPTGRPITEMKNKVAGPLHTARHYEWHRACDSEHHDARCPPGPASHRVMLSVRETTHWHSSHEIACGQSARRLGPAAREV